MKRLTALAGIFLTLAAGLPARAETGDGPRRFLRIEQQREERLRLREPRREERLRGQQERAEREGRPARLTPEERRQLRRDIREHGRKVYRNRPRRF